jgi:hypothetical protein
VRIRTVKPNFWGHRRLSKLGYSSRLIAIGLLNMADDEGYFEAEPELVRAALDPFSENSLIIQGAISELSDIGYILVREHPTEGKIGHVVKFTDHQKVNRPYPSKLRGIFEQSDSLNIHGVNNEHSLLERKGKEQGKEGNGKEQRAPARGQYSQEFESFWKLYPARNGKKTGKKEAAKCFKEALKKTTSKKIMEAVATQSKSMDWRKENGAFVPDAFRWLKKERWEDEVEHVGVSYRDPATAEAIRILEED